jgi:hypothetical protein
MTILIIIVTILIMTILIMTILIMTILIMTILIMTILIMTIVTTLYTGDITYNFNKCNIRYIFLSTVISKISSK